MRAAPARLSTSAARQIDAFLPELRRAARSKCATWAAADDLVQSTLLRLWSDHTDPIDEADLRAAALRILLQLAAQQDGRSQTNQNVA
ncbi:MAG: sigma factor [Pseudomonadota bacterium]